MLSLKTGCAELVLASDLQNREVRRGKQLKQSLVSTAVSAGCATATMLYYKAYFTLHLEPNEFATQRVTQFVLSGGILHLVALCQNRYAPSQRCRRYHFYRAAHQQSLNEQPVMVDVYFAVRLPAL